MTKWERQVSDALVEILEQEAAKKEKSSTLREYFRDELALRVAAAIEAAAQWGSGMESGKPWSDRALAALSAEIPQ